MASTLTLAGAAANQLSAGVAVNGSYWGNRYWGARYWGNRYWG